MPSTFADPSTPRYQLPFEQLPRGLVPFPERVVEALANEQTRLGHRFSDEQVRDQLERQTLVYYYQDYPVAYRSVPDGIEVVGVGFAEVARYWQSPASDVKVVQA
jgi:hypothetical protein